MQKNVWTWTLYHPICCQDNWASYPVLITSQPLGIEKARLSEKSQKREVIYSNGAFCLLAPSVRNLLKKKNLLTFLKSKLGFLKNHHIIQSSDLMPCRYNDMVIRYIWDRMFILIHHRKVKSITCNQIPLVFHNIFFIVLCCFILFINSNIYVPTCARYYAKYWEYKE